MIILVWSSVCSADSRSKGALVEIDKAKPTSSIANAYKKEIELDEMPGIRNELNDYISEN